MAHATADLIAPRLVLAIVELHEPDIEPSFVDELLSLTCVRDDVHVAVVHPHTRDGRGRWPRDQIENAFPHRFLCFPVFRKDGIADGPAIPAARSKRNRSSTEILRADEGESIRVSPRVLDRCRSTTIVAGAQNAAQRRQMRRPWHDFRRRIARRCPTSAPRSRRKVG